jgi:hypothetical protein
MSSSEANSRRHCCDIASSYWIFSPKAILHKESQAD